MKGYAHKKFVQEIKVEHHYVEPIENGLKVYNNSGFVFYYIMWVKNLLYYLLFNYALFGNYLFIFYLVSKISET